MCTVYSRSPFSSSPMRDVHDLPLLMTPASSSLIHAASEIDSSFQLRSRSGGVVGRGR